MVGRVRRRQRLATDDVDALGVHGGREIDILFGGEVGPWRRHAEELVGVGRLRSHTLCSSYDHATGAPRHHPQRLLLGDGVISVVQGIAEYGRDAAVVLAAVLEVLRDVFGEGGLLPAQEVADVVEPDHHRRQMLGQPRGDAARPAYKPLVHAPLAREFVGRF
jgi:hypothetical protein